MTTPAQDPRELLAVNMRELDDEYALGQHAKSLHAALEAALADRDEAVALLRDAWRALESDSMKAVTFSAYAHGVQFDPKDSCDGNAIAAFLARQQNPKESKP